VPDVNASSSNFTTIRGTAHGADSSGHDVIVFGLSLYATSGRPSSSTSSPPASSGPVRRLLRLLSPRRLERAQQAGRRVAREGWRLRLARPPAKGAVSRLRGIVERALVRRREQEQGIATLFSLFEQEADDAAAGGTSPASFDGTWVAIPDLEFDKPSAWHSRRRCSACM